jgi:hypothetical protein
LFVALFEGFNLHHAKQIFMTAVLLALPLPALATLGGDASTTQGDQLHMKATLRVSPGAKYAVHELTLPSGTAVREYVSPQGTVFAVAWKGPLKPDLRQLLGDYFDRYVQDAPNSHGSHAASRVVQPDFVVHSMGHMRAFTGRAYLPLALPAGVAVSELQ